jgi:hypothetical protein
MNKDQTKGIALQRKARAWIPVGDDLRRLNSRTLPTMRGRIALASVALVARITKRHKLHVAEHVGVFAGSLLHRGDWDHN